MQNLFSDIHWFRVKAGFEAKNTLSTSVYSIIEAVTKEVNNAIAFNNEKIIFHINEKPLKYRLSKNKKFHVTFLLLTTPQQATIFYNAIQVYFQDPWNSRNIRLLEISPPEFRNYSLLYEELYEKLAKQQELCIDFLTPLAFKPSHPKKRAHISLSEFLSLLSSRLKRLFHIESSITFNEEKTVFLPYWSYEELAVESLSQRGNTRYINGCTGKIYLRGEVDTVLPYLILCSELHAGSHLSYGRGYYIIYQDNSPSYINSIPIIETLQFYVDKNKEKFNGLNSQEITKQLYNSFITADYEPNASEAFIADNILTEKLYWKDQILHSFIYKILKNPVDNILPLTVLSFRPHISGKDIKARIDELITSGYDKILTFSIDGFYTQIDHTKLLNQLKRIIPLSDHFIIKLIEKLLKAGYIHEGKLLTRKKGLPMGSPLSPLLANIYLIDLDRALNDSETVALRHADTYLIFSLSEEALNEKLNQAKQLLQNLNLRINERSIKYDSQESITFAGIDIQTPQHQQRLRKPLYIATPDTHLSISSDTVKITNAQGENQTVPLNRISEIIINTDTVITTPMLRKCIKNNIPLIIASNFMSPVIIVKSDHKSHYESIVRHTTKYYSLTDEMINLYAKQIVSLKLKSYEIFLTYKRNLFASPIKDKLKHLRQKIIEATTLETIRGYEAIAAKEIYAALNLLIKNRDFHIKTRKRKTPDPINSLMNLCSHLTFNRIRTVVCSNGLNPYLGFLHSPDNNYESLVADLQELLRAKMDNFIVNLINLKVIEKKDFKEIDGAFVLKSSMLDTLIVHYEEYLNKFYSIGSSTLNDFIYAQVEKIKNWITKDEELIFEIPW
ncbi:CRISPR-associated endonuclease Cas1 [Thermodesulfovibrio sp. 3907-1M]|uniref:CRISPR-associated endonuclease Cas1 n=1 Tax=Thermodesulfovibrio autotrophicus TaxID=3118333 RepID=A0AAU8GZK4_9BACT